MSTLSKRSEKELELVDDKLVTLVRAVAAAGLPVEVICGHRGQKEQDEAFRTGHSKLKYPQSAHNSVPSQAVDILLNPVDWKNREQFILFAGFVLGLAKSLDIHVRWGGDWNRNFNVADEKFQDLVHFELDPQGKLF